MKKVLQDLHDAKQQILNFTDGRHYRVVEAITTAEQYIKDQNDKLDQYRKALIANVLQHYCPDWDGKERLYCYAEGAGERSPCDFCRRRAWPGLSSSAFAHGT